MLTLPSVPTHVVVSRVMSRFSTGRCCLGIQEITLVTLSTTEAEYVALALCLQELLYLKHLITELGLEFTETIPVYEDNQSCIKVASNHVLHARTN